MPERMVWRQPFPGPGLAIRIIGEVTEERLDTLREADSILQDEIRRAGLYRDLWQSFAVLPAIRSVGVQGDERTYAYPIVIRAVTSEDAMTADWARLPYDLLEAISSRIINEIPSVNRVVPRHLVEAAGDHRVGVDCHAPAGASGGRKALAAAAGGGRLTPAARLAGAAEAAFLGPESAPPVGARLGRASSVLAPLAAVGPCSSAPCAAAPPRGERRLRRLWAVRSSAALGCRGEHDRPATGTDAGRVRAAGRRRPERRPVRSPRHFARPRAGAA